ncbi:MAG: nitrophenyl compound nitroreductase subunit ArsF family protein [Candidatus Sumerlaeaceae bacterium]|nr:nitrophenyl compound nitroreductase subunit ArsF family protein [Candidatus Sumerlaeaceae bacterium]
MTVLFMVYCLAATAVLQAEPVAPAAQPRTGRSVPGGPKGSGRTGDAQTSAAKAQLENRLAPPADPDGVVPAPGGSPDRVIVYYIHGGPRCPSCVKIEKYTESALRSAFAEEAASGRIVWQPVNADVRGNEHFMKDYQLFTKSVVVVEVKNGKQTRWKNLPKVWELLGNQQDFEKHIVSEVGSYLR